MIGMHVHVTRWGGGGRPDATSGGNVYYNYGRVSKARRRGGRKLELAMGIPGHSTLCTLVDAEFLWNVHV